MNKANTNSHCYLCLMNKLRYTDDTVLITEKKDLPQLFNIVEEGAVRQRKD